MARPRLAFVSLWRASDPNVESGYAYSMRLQLQRYFEVMDVFPIALERPIRMLLMKIYFRCLGQYYNHDREPGVLKHIAVQIEEILRDCHADIIYSPSSIPLTYVRTKIPIVLCMDQVFGSLVTGYVRNAAGRFLSQGFEQENLALNSATLISFPTSWAAKAAVNCHQIYSSKIRVIPWGANLPDAPTISEVRDALDKKRGQPCQMVFIGRDWDRKRGRMVVQTVQRLNELGLQAKLTVIGCEPHLHDENIRCVPFLDKRDKRQFNSFKDIMLNSHFLFVPSRAEAFGQVFCEAAAFGVPSIGSDTGGISEVIQSGVTGLVMPVEASSDEIAKAIVRCLESEESYAKMAIAARLDFQSRLNWDRFGDKMITEMMEFL